MVALLQDIPQIPLSKWVNGILFWVIDNFGGFFSALSSVIDGVVGGLSLSW